MLDRALTEYKGQVRLVFKDFPLPGHALARPAHEAARCAGAAGRYWEYHDRLFEAQPNFERADLLRYAREIGIPVEPFTRCLEEGPFRDRVQADVAEGRRLGVTGTPTLIINGVPIRGAPPYDVLREVIEMLLKERERR